MSVRTYDPARMVLIIDGREVGYEHIEVERSFNDLLPRPHGRVDEVPATRIQARLPDPRARGGYVQVDGDPDRIQDNGDGIYRVHCSSSRVIEHGDREMMLQPPPQGKPWTIEHPENTPVFTDDQLCVKGCTEEWEHDGPCRYPQEGEWREQFVERAKQDLAELRGLEKQADPMTATGEYLDRIAENFGVARRPALAASGTFGATGEETDEQIRERLQRNMRGLPEEMLKTGLPGTQGCGDPYYRGAAEAHREMQLAKDEPNPAGYQGVWVTGDWMVSMPCKGGPPVEVTHADLFEAAALAKVVYEERMKARLSKKAPQRKMQDEWPDEWTQTGRWPEASPRPDK